MTSDKVVDGLPGTSVGNMLKLQPCELCEPLADEVSLRASSGGHVAYSGLLLCCHNQFRNPLNTQRGMNSQNLREVDQLDDRHDVFHVVNIEGHNVRGACHHVGRREQRVAIRGALSDGLDAEHSSSAGLVFDNNLLSP